MFQLQRSRQLHLATTDSNTIERDQLQRLYRDVVIGALRDMGMGDTIEARDVRLWMSRDTFHTVCHLANWDDEWIVDLFRSIDELPQQIKRPLTRKCLELLRAIARVAEGNHDNGGSWPMIHREIHSWDDPLKYNEGKSKSILARMSQKSHESHGGWNRGRSLRSREGEEE